MSYEVQAALVRDSDFQSRCQSVFTEQALIFKDDGRGDMAALANQLLRNPNALWGGSSSVFNCFLNILAGSPGFANEVDKPEGIDSSQISDGELLAGTQAQWPVVAGLYYNSDGSQKA